MSLQSSNNNKRIASNPLFSHIVHLEVDINYGVQFYVLKKTS